MKGRGNGNGQAQPQPAMPIPTITVKGAPGGSVEIQSNFNNPMAALNMLGEAVKVLSSHVAQQKQAEKSAIQIARIAGFGG